MRAQRHQLPRQIVQLEAQAIKPAKKKHKVQPLLQQDEASHSDDRVTLWARQVAGGGTYVKHCRVTFQQFVGIY